MSDNSNSGIGAAALPTVDLSSSSPSDNSSSIPEVSQLSQPSDNSGVNEGETTQGASADQNPGTPEEKDKARRAKQAMNLAKMESKALREKQELNREREKWQAEIAADKQAIADFKKLQTIWEEDPKAVLRALNIDENKYYQKLTGQYIRETQVSPEVRELQDFKTKQEKLLAEAQDQAKQAVYNQNLSNYRNQVVNTVQQNAEQYELLNQTKAYIRVEKLMVDYWNETGTTCSIEEACAVAEQQLEQAFDNEIYPIVQNSKKLKGKFGTLLSKQEASETALSKEQNEDKASSRKVDPELAKLIDSVKTKNGALMTRKNDNSRTLAPTLTNRMDPDSSVSKPKATLSREERKALILAKFQ